MKSRVGIVSLGCPRNLVDSEHMLGRLLRKGYKLTDLEGADVGIVNTCAFVKDAKTESIDAILDLIELKKAGKLKKIVVCGCLVQRYAAELAKEFPEVDSFIGSPRLTGGERVLLTPKSFAYLKICEGCVNKCSFCAVPLIKPGLESLTRAQVFRELDALDEAGITEVDIIGQDITGYGLDRGKQGELHKIVEAILRHSSYRPRWFRLLYLHPARVRAELLELFKGEERLCRYIDLPLQHINDRILRSMNRHTTRKQILELIAMIRKAVPGVALRTTFIIGFPGETDREFEELLDFVEDTRFDRLGAFMYSAEEGTRAASFPGQVGLEVMKERFDRVMRVQQRISREYNEALLGRKLDVIIDEQEDGHWLGRTQADAPEVDGTVFVFSKRQLKSGEIVRVKVTDTLEYDIRAEVDNEHSE